MVTSCVVAVGLADIRRAPDPVSELVTQALMNVTAMAADVSGSWTHVVLADYEGWIQSDALAAPIVKGFCKVGEQCATPLGLFAVVTATHAVLSNDAEDDESLETVYLSTCLPLLDTTHAQRLQVALPGERTGWIARHAASIRHFDDRYPQKPVAAVTAYARAFLDIPYLWGGTSWQGIDCSGFVQLCYRMGGYTLPRDADQQEEALAQSVPREEIQEGDLIFFGQTQITHVALALNKNEYIHAEGQAYERVIVNSFDPGDVHYNQRLSTIVWTIKRVVL